MPGTGSCPLRCEARRSRNGRSGRGARPALASMAGSPACQGRAARCGGPGLVFRTSKLRNREDRRPAAIRQTGLLLVQPGEWGAPVVSGGRLHAPNGWLSFHPKWVGNTDDWIARVAARGARAWLKQARGRSRPEPPPAPAELGTKLFRSRSRAPQAAAPQRNRRERVRRRPLWLGRRRAIWSRSSRAARMPLPMLPRRQERSAERSTPDSERLECGWCNLEPAAAAGAADQPGCGRPDARAGPDGIADGMTSPTGTATADAAALS